MKTQRTGFTLIELLVVIAIIAILASLVLPAISKAKTAAVAADCQSRLHQWGIGATLYLANNEDVFPREDAADGFNPWPATTEETNRSVWYNCLPVEMKVRPASEFAQNLAMREEFYRKQNVFVCPAADFTHRNPTGPNFSLAWNSQLIFENERILASSVLEPSRTALMLDTGVPGEKQFHPNQRTYDGQPKGFASRFSTRHRGGGNILMVGGNVGRWAGEKVVNTKGSDSKTLGRDIFPPVDVVWTRDPAEAP
jgi:prepilin-type N-terminal cleavage/methylation domain-containing protein/prepilin-type processing-associated H-X9-DG protein